MAKFGSTKGVGSPTLDNVIQNIWLYTHNEPIVDIVMDPAGNLVINKQYVRHGNGLLKGYTVMSHDMPKGKILLRKDNI